MPTIHSVQAFEAKNYGNIHSATSFQKRALRIFSCLRTPPESLRSISEIEKCILIPYFYLRKPCLPFLHYEKIPPDYRHRDRNTLPPLRDPDHGIRE